MPSPLAIVPRADDAGLNPGTNEGIRQSVVSGIVRNVSVLAIGPSLDDAVSRLRGLDACFGFHACLNAEWTSPRWPALTRAASLADAEGMLPATPAELRMLDPSPETVVAEMAAQLARLRSTGLPVSYMDEHMVFSATLPNLRPALAEFARSEGLIYRMDLPNLPRAAGEEGLAKADHAGRFLARLASASSGTWVVVSHPAIHSPDMQEVCLPGQAPGLTAADRVQQALVFTRPDVISYCREHSLRLLRYDEIPH
jgi:predicted glycoside hydrolase/deacetylase ChbG (UPF0249 family)